MVGHINKIETLGLKDGPGIRVIVFMSGCPIRCIYCHNPEMFKLTGDSYTPEALVKFILRYKPYFKDQGGVTFSGGEPLFQADFLLAVCKLLRMENINVTLDTCGIGLKNEELLNYIDLVIMDIKALNQKDYYRITGFDYFNESLTFIKKCSDFRKSIWFRQVIIPEINDHEKYMKALKEFISKYQYQRIELLPYHTMAKPKYAELNLPYRLDKTSALNIDLLESLKSHVE